MPCRAGDSAALAWAIAFSIALMWRDAPRGEFCDAEGRTTVRRKRRKDMDPRQGELLRTILPAHRFYARKFAGLPLDDWMKLPFTTKDELLANQAEHPPYGELLTYPLERYTRLHQTSGTKGAPLRWLDTPESWERMLGSWRTMFDAAGVTKAD